MMKCKYLARPWRPSLPLVHRSCCVPSCIRRSSDNSSSTSTRYCRKKPSHIWTVACENADLTTRKKTSFNFVINLRYAVTWLCDRLRIFVDWSTYDVICWLIDGYDLLTDWPMIWFVDWSTDMICWLIDLWYDLLTDRRIWFVDWLTYDMIRWLIDEYNLLTDRPMIWFVDWSSYDMICWLINLWYDLLTDRPYLDWSK